MPDTRADCFEVLDRWWLPPPVVLTRDNIGGRIGRFLSSNVFAVNFHRRIIGDAVTVRKYQGPRHAGTVPYLVASRKLRHKTTFGAEVSQAPRRHTPPHRRRERRWVRRYSRHQHDRT